MEREGKRGRGNGEGVWESKSRRGGSSCCEGSDLAGQSKGAELHVPSKGVGVRPKHGGLRKMKPLPHQIRRAQQSFPQEEISTNLNSPFKVLLKGDLEAIRPSEGGNQSKQYYYFFSAAASNV